MRKNPTTTTGHTLREKLVMDPDVITCFLTGIRVYLDNLSKEKTLASSNQIL